MQLKYKHVKKYKQKPNKTNLVFIRDILKNKKAPKPATLKLMKLYINIVKFPKILLTISIYSNKNNPKHMVYIIKKLINQIIKVLIHFNRITLIDQNEFSGKKLLLK